MENEHSYQSQFIWKQTTHDGLLPITNFTEGVKEEDAKKKGKQKDKGKELGVITEFQSQEQPSSPQKQSIQGQYAYHLKQQKYVLLKSKPSPDSYLVFQESSDPLNKTSKDNTITVAASELCFEVEINIRVIISEDSRFSITIKKNANAKIKQISEDLSELINTPKYSMTFFFQGEKLSFGERLGDKSIGAPIGQLNESFLLCLKGGNEGPKAWKRFLHTDDPCRQLTYLSDDEGYDAISYIPKRDIIWAGFSVYHVASCESDFKCLYKYKIGGESAVESEIELFQADVKDGMSDIIFENEIPVKAGKAITIMVRFLAGDEYFCSTLLGYGGENYMNVENEEREMFEIKETPDCTKGETDLRFGNIPRIFYF